MPTLTTGIGQRLAATDTEARAWFGPRAAPPGGIVAEIVLFRLYSELGHRKRGGGEYWHQRKGGANCLRLVGNAALLGCSRR